MYLLIIFLYDKKVKELNYDDALMIKQAKNILKGNYLGDYSPLMLIKGPIFPLILALVAKLKITMSLFLTMLYILVNIYFIYSLKNIINNKKYLLFIFIILLFNPASYSQVQF